MTVPAGTRHDWWNAGDGDAGVLVELSPPEPRFEAMIATLFGLGNAGKTNAKGMPDPFQLALIAREFADVIQFTKPPAPDLQPHGRVTPDPQVLALAGLDA